MPSLPGDGMSGLFMPGNTILRMALAHITDTPASAVPVPPQRPSPASSPSPSSAGITVQANRKGFIETVGEGIELLPAATFKIKLENAQEILCHLSGRMRMHRIMILPGDKVKVEMTPYDLSKGRITYRF